MPRFVVYEVWVTTAKFIDAANEAEAYEKSEPKPRPEGLNLSNWHAMRVPEKKVVVVDEEKLRMVLAKP